MKLNYTVNKGKEVPVQEKPLSLNTKVDMQTRLTKALQSKQAGQSPMVEMPVQSGGFGRTN